MDQARQRGARTEIETVAGCSGPSPTAPSRRLVSKQLGLAKLLTRPPLPLLPLVSQGPVRGSSLRPSQPAPLSTTFPKLSLLQPQTRPADRVEALHAAVAAMAAPKQSGIIDPAKQSEACYMHNIILIFS